MASSRPVATTRGPETLTIFFAQIFDLLSDNCRTRGVFAGNRQYSGAGQRGLQDVGAHGPLDGALEIGLADAQRPSRRV
jgi:hypothetical protein